MNKIFKRLTVAVIALCIVFGVGMAIAPTNYQPAYAAVYQQGSSGATVKTIQTKLHGRSIPFYVCRYIP